MLETYVLTLLAARSAGLRLVAFIIAFGAVEIGRTPHTHQASRCSKDCDRCRPHKIATLKEYLKQSQAARYNPAGNFFLSRRSRADLKQKQKESSRRYQDSPPRGARVSATFFRRDSNTARIFIRFLRRSGRSGTGAPTRNDSDDDAQDNIVPKYRCGHRTKCKWRYYHPDSENHISPTPACLSRYACANDCKYCNYNAYDHVIPRCCS